MPYLTPYTEKSKQNESRKYKPTINTDVNERELIKYKPQAHTRQILTRKRRAETSHWDAE